MRIQFKDLSLHLERELKNFYFVFGEEPLQHKEAIDIIRSFTRKSGYIERHAFELNPSFNWEQLLEYFNTSNLFSDKRLIECCIPDNKFGKATVELLNKLSALPSVDNTIILLIAYKIENKLQQTTWFKELEQKGMTILARALSKDETMAWLERRLVANGLPSDQEMIHLLFQRTEGNLLAAVQAIEKLRLYGKNDTALPYETLLAATNSETRFTLFDLIDAALSGAIQRTIQIFWSLKSEGMEPILLLWAVAKEVRTVVMLSHQMKDGMIQDQAWKEQGIWKRREPLIKAFIHRFSIPKLQMILHKIKQIDDLLKGRIRKNIWNELLIIYLTLAGAPDELV